VLHVPDLTKYVHRYGLLALMSSIADCHEKAPMESVWEWINLALRVADVIPFSKCSVRT
jgi:hypothetical protein